MEEQTGALKPRFHVCSWHAEPSCSSSTFPSVFLSALIVKMWISCLLVPAVLGKTFFSETFDHADAVPSAWVVSSVKEDYGSWGISAGKFFADPVTSKGLKTMDNARFYSISVALDETVNTADSDLVIQFSVKHEQSIDCGGGYVKLMPPSFKQAEFSGDSEYAVMFGPDICGTSAKVHSILSFDGTNHEIKNKIRAEKDQMTRTYRNFFPHTR